MIIDRVHRAITGRTRRLIDLVHRFFVVARAHFDFRNPDTSGAGG